jgi:hypothetical protein
MKETIKLTGNWWEEKEGELNNKQNGIVVKFLDVYMYFLQ